MKKSIYLRKTSGERGVALFFALGILAVLIVTVLVFANRATTDLKVASAYASSTQTRHFAESAMNRALANISKNSAIGVNFYSEEPSGDNANTFDWLWKIETEDVQLPGNAPVRWQYIDNGETDSAKKELIGRYAYYLSGMNLLNLNALLTHNDLCNGETCDHGSDKICTKHLGRTLAELTYDYTKLQIYSDKDATNRIDFKKSDLVAKKTAAPVKIQTYGSFELLKAYWSIKAAMYGKRVEDFFLVTDAVSQNETDAWFVGDLDSNKVKDKAEFFHRFNLNREENTWKKMVQDGTYKTNAVDVVFKDLGTNNGNYAFYDGSGNVTENKDTGILWLRNWSDTEGHWSSADVKAKQIIANLINYNAPTDTPVVSDIDPKNWNGSSKPAYTGNKRTWYLNEAWISINTINTPGAAVAVQSPDAEGNPVTRYYKWENPTMQVRIELKPEIINMFRKDGDWPGNAADYSVKAYGKIFFKYGKNNFAFGTESFTQNAMTSVDAACNLDGSNGSELIGAEEKNYAYFNLGSGSGASYIYESTFPVGAFAHNNDISTDDTQLANGGYFTLDNLDIDLQLVLYKGSEAVDYVKLKKDSTLLSGALRNNGKCTRDAYPYAFSLEVNDPRHNLHAESWDIVSAPAYDGGETKGTLLSVNSKFSLTGGDTEVATDPAADADKNLPRISTAYIRHASMESLWEIGAIHRAAPWQTINLTKPTNAGSITDDLKTDLRTKGGGAYGEGDFRILDQITIQELKDDGSGNKKPVAVDKFGKINLNAAPSKVKNFTLDALFRDMVFHKNGAYDYKLVTVAADQHLISAPSEDMIAALAAPVQKDRIPLYRRTDIYLSPAESQFWKLFDGSLGIEQKTDANKEQLIGRIIQLTKASTNYDVARLVVIAQSIKDVGDASGNVEIYVDRDEDGDVTDTPDAEAAKKNSGYWKYGANKDVQAIFGNIPGLDNKVMAKKGRYDNGADRITGTVKMTAYLLYDKVTQKWKLIWVKYE